MKNMKNIKRYSKTVGVLASSALLICQAAQADIISPAGPVPTDGTPVDSVLGSSGGFGAGDDLTVVTTVTLGGGGVYTYTYVVTNPGTQTDPNGVENFAVTVNEPVITIGQ